MAEPALLEFRVSGAGWAEVTLGAVGAPFKMSVSYLTDPLGDLVRFALLAATGAYEGAIVLDGEGTEWRIEFAADQAFGEAGLLQITVWDHQGWPRPEDQKLFRADFPTLQFCREVLQAAVAMRMDYVRAWGREVCSPAAVAALEAALAVGRAQSDD
jgi:hypothetical protein